MTDSQDDLPFDRKRSDELRDQALTQVEENATEEFKSEANAIIRHCASTVPEFTSDRVWYFLKQKGVTHPREGRIMGALIRGAACAGIIEKTDRTVKSTIPTNHSRDIRVWRSLIFKA